MQLRSHLGGDYEVAHPIEWYLRAIEEEESGVSLAALERQG